MGKGKKSVNEQNSDEATTSTSQATLKRVSSSVRKTGAHSVTFSKYRSTRLSSVDIWVLKINMLLLDVQLPATNETP